MIKKLVSHLGEYKRAAVLTPLFAALEAVMDVLLPTIMAFIIDQGLSLIHISPLCSGHIQRNHFLNYKSGKSADFPDLFFHPRSRKGKQHNQRKTSLPGRSRCGSRAGRFYFIREKYGKSVR